MIRALLAIQLGLSVAVVFAIWEALAPTPRRTVAALSRDQRRDDLAEMIVDLSGYFEGVDLNVSPEEIDATLFGGEPVKITISGYYGGWPYDTITEDALN